MNELPLVLANDDIVRIVMVGGLTIAVLSIITGMIRSLYRERVRGRTAREIAAYVAEGSMTPEEGERLLRASQDPVKGCS